ncbi:MAG TPA: hypothetical protein VKW04_21600 [Planctomycetota bacterium]|nr:hypothetical protein [Planctomycetota bacterium]
MKRLAAALFVLSAAAPALAQDELVGFRVREWYARVSGTVEADSSGLGSTTIDLDHDIGLGDRNWTPELQAYLHLPVLGRIYGGWWHLHDTGHETLSEQIDYANQSFAVGTPVNSEFTLDVGYLTYEFAFPTIPLGNLLKLELAVSAGARAIRGDASISDGSQSAHDNGIIGFPTLGAHVTLKLFDYIRTEVEVQGLVFRYSNNEVHYIETFAEATVEPLPWVFAGVGYKLAVVNLQHSASNSFHVDIDISGIYLTVGVRF